MSWLPRHLLQTRGGHHVSGHAPTPPPPPPPPPDPPPPPPLPSPDYRSEFYNTRMGYGASCDAGLGPSYTVVWVENNGDGGIGSLKAALAVVGPTIVQFRPGVGSITDAAKTGYPMTDNTLLDGYGWRGVLYGALKSANCDNVVIMYMSVTQPFKYGADPSGGVFMGSNCPRFYIWRCNGWDTGDVIFASGAYDLPGTDKPPPYYGTVAECRMGPNPGEYAIMSPIRGTHPGYYPGYVLRGGIDNDAANGKGMNDAYDHSSPLPFSTFDHKSFVTMYHNVLQGNQIRNGKVRAETLDFICNVIAKYGTTRDLGGPGIHHGAGSALDGTGTARFEGNVYIPYVNGEQFVGFQNAVADRNGVAHWLVTDAASNTAIKMEGTATTDGNAVIRWNWVTGQTVEAPGHTTGFTRPYSVPDVIDRSGDTAAQALVHRLEDDPATRAGNPWSTVQPPNWRDVHTGGSFPVT
jgi:hypothetical protein